MVRRASILAFAAALACGGAPETPEEVTADFWRAVAGRDIARARERASSGTTHLVGSFLREAPIEDVLLGETLRDEGSASVSTSLTTRPGEQPLRVTFPTHLVREGDGWRVEVDRTHAAFQKAVFVGGMRELGDAVGRGARELGEAIDEGGREMERALREATEDPQP